MISQCGTKCGLHPAEKIAKKKKNEKIRYKKKLLEIKNHVKYSFRSQPLSAFPILS